MSLEHGAEASNQMSAPCQGSVKLTNELTLKEASSHAPIYLYACIVQKHCRYCDVIALPARTQKVDLTLNQPNLASASSKLARN
jgi:hypothetical protein